MLPLSFESIYFLDAELMIVNLQTLPGNLSLKNASEDEAPFAGNHENTQLHTGE